MRARAQARAIHKITVIVRDSTGNPVEDAKVSVTRIEGGYDRLWRTNASGEWTFVNAPAGNYVINARFLKGRFEVGEVEVYVDGDVTVDVSMSTPEEMVIIEDFSHDTRFVVSELTIEPAVVEFNETVEISVVLNNIGERAGTYNITLRVYGPFLYRIPSNMFGMSLRQVKGGDFEVDSERFTPQESYCAEGTYNVSLGGLRGSFTVKPKKTFEVIVNDFQVHPLGIEVEDEDDVWTFRISYNVTNLGDYYGNYRVRSKIDGTVVDSNVFFLEAGETQSYLFEVDRGIGTYQVEVEEFTESIEVKLIPMGQVYDPKTISYGSIFIGLIVIIIILWYARARKF